MFKIELENRDFRKSLYFYIVDAGKKKEKKKKKKKKRAASGCWHYIKGGGSPLKFWKTRFRDNGWPKRYTQWANFLVGFVAQKPYGAAVVATPIFRPKWVHFF